MRKGLVAICMIFIFLIVGFCGCTDNSYDDFFGYWDYMPIEDESRENYDSDNIINIGAPSQVNKNEVFDIRIEIIPPMHNSYQTTWIFLTEENTQNTKLYFDREGFEYDKFDYKISIDYIKDDYGDEFSLFLLSPTAGELIINGLSPSVCFDVLFNILGYSMNVGSSPPEWAVNIGENYLLSVDESEKEEICSVIQQDENLEPSIILIRAKYFLSERRNSLNYELKLKAPYLAGTYKLTQVFNYSYLEYNFYGFWKKRIYVSAIDSLLVDFKQLAQDYQLRYNTEEVVDSVYITVK